MHDKDLIKLTLTPRANRNIHFLVINKRKQKLYRNKNQRGVKANAEKNAKTRINLWTRLGSIWSNLIKCDLATKKEKEPWSKPGSRRSAPYICSSNASNSKCRADLKTQLSYGKCAHPANIMPFWRPLQHRFGVTCANFLRQDSG
jgi:hypothetical protein